MGAVEPTEARLVGDDLLTITWSDGRTLHYPLDHLRASCPCAHCAPAVLDGPPLERELFAGVRLKRLEEIGNYAFRIAFSDGHDLGLYTWPKLLAIGFRPEEEPPPLPAPGSFEV
jgi:DUF971 family protein